MDNLQSEARAPQALFDRLPQASVAATKEQTRVFTYVDLIMECCPYYTYSGMHAVGGDGFDCGAGGTLDASDATSIISPMANALNKASRPSKFFRSVPQWTAAFIRYLPAAASAKQLSWAAGLAHMDACLRVSEEVRQNKDHTGVGIT